MGVIGLLFGVSSLVLTGLIPKASVRAQAEVLVSQLRQQQLKAMSGATEGLDESGSYGVYFGDNYYTLFHGSAYDPDSSRNYTVTLDDPAQLSTTFTDRQVVFASGSGEVAEYTADRNNCTIFRTDTINALSLDLNQYGVVTIGE